MRHLRTLNIGRGFYATLMLYSASMTRYCRLVGLSVMVVLWLNCAR